MTIKLTDIQLEKLESLYPKVSAFLSKVDGILAPQVVAEIKEIKKTFEDVFKEKWEEDEVVSQSRYDDLKEIEDANKFVSNWSISEVSVKDLNNLFNKRGVISVRYKSWGSPQKKILNKGKYQKVTWLDMWKIADELIKLSEDTHHIFIEDFEEDKQNPGVYNLYCGS